MVDGALSHLRSCLCREADAPSDQVGFRSLGSGQGIRVVSLVSLVATGCLVSVAGLLRGFLLIIGKDIVIGLVHSLNNGWVSHSLRGKAQMLF